VTVPLITLAAGHRKSPSNAIISGHVPRELGSG